MKRMILASGSPRRKELLQMLEVPFEVLVSDTKEVITKNEPAEVTKELSYQKAMAVAEQVEEGIIIGADTIVMVIDGKPYSLRRMLKCNEKLMEQMKNLDFEEIIRRKINIIGEDKVYIYRDFFSSKEIDIINKISDLTLSMKKNMKNCFN